MKKKWLKWICPVLALVLVAGIGAGFALNATGTKYPFRVGYGIVSIQPDSSFTNSLGGLPLAGYGNTSRRRADYAKSAEYDYDELQATCIALADENDNTVLLFAIDAISITEQLYSALCLRMEKQFSIPKENIILNASHSHSTIDYDNGEAISTKYTNFLLEQLCVVGKAAMEDLTELDTMSYGSVEVEQTAGDGTVQRMNFTRHYTALYKNKTTGETETYVRGDNFIPIGYYTGELTFSKYTGHALDADPTLYLVLFQRKGGKAPVVLSNFRAHPHSQGGSDETRITADTVGAIRYYMAKEGYLLAHFQGAAGMTNSNSIIASDMILSQFSSGDARKARTSADTGWVSGQTEPFLVQYGKTMVGFMKTCLASNMTSATPHTVTGQIYNYVADTNKSQVSMYDKAVIVQDMWNNPENYVDLLPALKDANVSTINSTVRSYAAKKYGIRSVYQANAIVAQYSRMDKQNINLNTLAIDDIICIGTVPDEMFHQNSIDFEDSAVASGKFKMAMTFGYTNGSNGYLPSLPVWDYTSYETDITHFAPGTGEKVAEAFCNMLGVEYHQTPKDQWK